MNNGEAKVKGDKVHNNLKKTWQKRSKRQQKIILLLVGLLGSTFLVILMCLLFIPGYPTICNAVDCHAASKDLQNYIDETQKQCDDFYNFACGMFLRNYSHEDQYLSKSVKNLMREKIQSDVNDILQEPINDEDVDIIKLAKQFYKTCMNEKSVEDEGLKQIKSIFKKIGGWPVLEGPDWDGEKFDILIATKTLRDLGVNPDFFLSIHLDIDKENVEKYVLVIKHKSYTPSNISLNSQELFVDYMVDVVSQFEAINANVWKDQKDVLDFLLQMAQISAESSRSNQTGLYNLHTISELQHEFPSIPWLHYVQGVLGRTVRINFDDVINVSEPVFLRKLQNLLIKTEKRVLANFMGWQTLQQLINYLPSRILDRAYDYLRKVNGKYDKPSRWRICVDATRDKLSAAVNLAFINKYFNEDIRENVTTLIRNVKNQFKRNLLTQDWLDAETKKKVVKTLLASVEKIFSFSDIDDIVKEENFYRDVEIRENKLLDAVLDLEKVSLDVYYSLLRKNVKDQWVKTQEFLTGFKVVYSPYENKLKFPLGLFTGIYYNQNRPDYMNYGLLGTILAHQISHMFVEARAYHIDAPTTNNQRLYSWWSPMSLNRYLDKLECLSNHYSRLEWKSVKKNHPNSLKTRDEDVADVAGFKIAYAAYLEKEWRDGKEPQLPGLKYTSKQLFWISSALQFCSKYSVKYIEDRYTNNIYYHSPNEIRVNGPLRNLPEFAADFGCPSGSYMNPEKKCNIW